MPSRQPATVTLNFDKVDKNKLRIHNKEKQIWTCEQFEIWAHGEICCGGYSMASDLDFKVQFSHLEWGSTLVPLPAAGKAWEKNYIKRDDYIEKGRRGFSLK